jgi:orotate phosphoribosyltransferase
VTDPLAPLPLRNGHFLLESGYHTDIWITLDALFLEPRTLGPAIQALAQKLSVHDVTAVCGPLLGGAFLAQSVATALDVRFYYAELVDHSNTTSLFGTTYRLPAELERTAGVERFAVVDDVISAGSSVRATIAAIEAAGGSTVVVGALTVLGNTGRDHLAQADVPLVTLGHRDFNLWNPEDCPLCQAGIALQHPEHFDDPALNILPPEGLRRHR